MPTTKSEKLAGWASVTEVTSSWVEPALIDWRVKVGNKESKRISTLAMKLGTRIHELCGVWHEKGKYTLGSKDSIEVANGMKAWDEFVAQYDPHILCMEKEVRHDGLKLVGHIDMIATIRGRDVLIDIKTSSQVRPAYWLQVHAYAMMEGHKFDVGILLLDKNLGTCKLDTMVYNDSYTEAFMGLLKAYRYFNFANGEESEGANGSDSPTDRTLTDRQEVAVPEVRVHRSSGDWEVKTI
jgi:CRISPR/Cas system-associated exonuclease Cas4 (RecB family)